MNKLLTKVAKLALGLSLAAGVGVAIGSNAKKTQPVDAATTSISLDFTSSLYGISTTQGNQTLTGAGATYGFEFAKGSGTGAKASGASPSSTSYVLFGKSGVYFRNTSAPSNSYISAISWTYASGVSTNVVLGIGYGTSALDANASVTNQPKATANGTVNLTPTDTTKSYFVIKVTNAYNCQWKSFSVTWTENAPVGNTYAVTYTAGTNGTGSYTHSSQPEGNYSLLPFASLTGVSASTGYRFKDYTVGGVSKNPGDVISLNAATSVTVNFEEKPQEFEESFSTASAWTTVTANTEYTHTNNLITATWEKGTSGSNAGAYWNPARFYKNHTLRISATTGTGAVTTINSIEFTCVSGSSGSPAVNYNDALYGSTVTVTKPTSSPGTVSVAKDGLVITHTMSGTVTEILITFTNQTRVSSFTVVYEKDQSIVPLQSISATCEGVLVSQQVTPVVTFNPASATNKTVTYSITNGSEFATIDSTTGLVTGIGAGTATITITPDDDNAQPITVNVVVTSLPTVHGVTVGTRYAMVADLSGHTFELSGIHSSGNYPYGEATDYDTDPSNLMPVHVVNGLYSHTVALQVEIDSAVKYLSYDKNDSNNNLTAVSSIDRSSSWIFNEEDSELVIRNVDTYTRKLGATSTGTPAVGRFACYQNLSATVITPTFVEIVEARTDAEYVQEFVDDYLHMDYTENLGYCNDNLHGWYLVAKGGYNQLIYGVSARENLFASDATFAAAKARYEAWAAANGDLAPYDGNDDIQSMRTNLFAINNVVENTNTIAIIVIISLVSVTAIGGYFFIKRREEN